MVPQPPQFIGSFDGLMQLPPQHMKPGPHPGLHAPPVPAVVPEVFVVPTV